MNTVSRKTSITLEDLYPEIIKSIESASDPAIRSLAMVESRLVHLAKNWIIDNPRDDYSIPAEVRHHTVRGEVSGIVGSFLIIGRDVIDVDELTGYVVRTIDTKHNQG